MTWLGWLGSVWLILCGLVVGSLWFFREQAPDPLRNPEWDDEMGYRRKVRRLATDAMLGDADDIVRPQSCAPRIVHCEELDDFDRRDWNAILGDDEGVDPY